MNKNLYTIILFTIICIHALAEKDTTYYYGANNKPSDPNNAVLKKRIIQASTNRYKIITDSKQDSIWVFVTKETVRIKGENEFLIREFGKDGMTKIYSRLYSKNLNGLFTFTETWENKILRTGTSQTLIPLSLEGKETKFYDNGQKKSESIYKNNQLISNSNWLKSGEEYIGNIFYSVDHYPEYKPGTKLLHKYLSEYIIQSEYPIENLDGFIITGFVITETGEITGIHVVSSIVPEFDDIVADAFKTIPGDWEPARLGNETVKCYLTMPINFRHQEGVRFEHLEFTYANHTWMMYW